MTEFSIISKTQQFRHLNQISKYNTRDVILITHFNNKIEEFQHLVGVKSLGNADLVVEALESNGDSKKGRRLCVSRGSLMTYVLRI